MSSIRFFDPYAEIDVHRNFLPHWQQPGATYFITFRLADSLPAELRAAWQTERSAWLEHHPPPWTADLEREYHQRLADKSMRGWTRVTASVVCAKNASAHR